jgi:integrase
MQRKVEVLRGRKLPDNLRAKAVTFSELLDDAIEHTERHTPLDAEKRYKCRVELLQSGLGGMAAGNITPQMISRWLSKAKHENHWKPATANRYKAMISLAFRLGIENGKCEHNPARLVKRMRENNERVRHLSPEEEKRLRDAIRSHCPEHLPELDIALNTGMRQGEQFGLVWSDVDLVGQRVTLRRTKNGSIRHLPLNRDSLAAFQSLWNRSTGEGHVFISARGGQPLKKPRFWWNQVIRAAKISDFHWHDLRHTFASRCVMAGVDIRTLQQLLGHKTLQMVVRYTHLSQAHELAAVERLCGRLEDTHMQTDTKTDTVTFEQLRTMTQPQ